MPEPEGKHFLLVEWCDDGQKGILVDSTGKPFSKDGVPHTNAEMWEILAGFSFILSGESAYLTKEEVAEYTYYRPLAELKNEYGIALKKKPKEKPK